jgi:hypothetical protein
MRRWEQQTASPSERGGAVVDGDGFGSGRVKAQDAAVGNGSVSHSFSFVIFSFSSFVSHYVWGHKTCYRPHKREKDLAIDYENEDDDEEED